MNGHYLILIYSNELNELVIKTNESVIAYVLVVLKPVCSLAAAPPGLLTAIYSPL